MVDTASWFQSPRSVEAEIDASGVALACEPRVALKVQLLVEIATEQAMTNYIFCADLRRPGRIVR